MHNVFFVIQLTNFEHLLVLVPHKCIVIYNIKEQGTRISQKLLRNLTFHINLFTIVKLTTTWRGKKSFS